MHNRCFNYRKNQIERVENNIYQFVRDIANLQLPNKSIYEHKGRFLCVQCMFSEPQKYELYYKWYA